MNRTDMIHVCSNMGGTTRKQTGFKQTIQEETKTYDVTQAGLTPVAGISPRLDVGNAEMRIGKEDVEKGDIMYLIMVSGHTRR